jgi:hypothetical protein
MKELAPGLRAGSTTADVAEQRGTGLVNRLMLVRIQSSALNVNRPDGVTNRTGLS